MSGTVCFRCRRPLPKGETVCPHCENDDLVEPELAEQTDDPEAVRRERSFLLREADNLANPVEPRFMGLKEEELVWRNQRVPRLPLGHPHLALTEDEPLEVTLRKLVMGERWERGQAAIRLGQTSAERPEPNTVMRLLRRLSDRDADVRICVLWALARLANTMLLPPLLELEKLEKDVTVRPQLAATLYQIVASPQKKDGRMTPRLERRLEEKREILSSNPTAADYVVRGRTFLRSKLFLKAIGDFGRALDMGLPEPHQAYLYRSQAFLLMGKPLFALDDLLACPEEEGYSALFHFHRATLKALAKQIVSTARSKGLEDYADLFQKRLDRFE